MESNELSELTEKAREGNEKGIGLTMAVVAVFLALATMLGHRAHTEEVVLQTKVNDQWSYYQAKNNRGQMYGADAQLAALLTGGGALQQEFSKRAADEKKGSAEVRRQAEELDKETEVQARHAAFFDGSEIFLEISIVLCSIALLTGTRLFWKLSFVTTIIGLLVGLGGFSVRLAALFGGH